MGVRVSDQPCYRDGALKPVLGSLAIHKRLLWSLYDVLIYYISALGCGLEREQLTYFSCLERRFEYIRY